MPSLAERIEAAEAELHRLSAEAKAAYRAWSGLDQQQEAAAARLRELRAQAVDSAPKKFTGPAGAWSVRCAAHGRSIAMLLEDGTWRCPKWVGDGELPNHIRWIGNDDAARIAADDEVVNRQFPGIVVVTGL